MYTFILMSSRKNSVRQHTISRRHILFFLCVLLLLCAAGIGGIYYGFSQKHQRANAEKDLQAKAQKEIEELTQEKRRVESELTDVNEKMKAIHQMTEQIKQALGILGQGGGISSDPEVSEGTENPDDTQQENASAMVRNLNHTHEKQEPLTLDILQQEILSLYNYIVVHQTQLDEYPSILPVDLQQPDGEKHVYWYSSGFGWRLHPLTQKREFHQGLDIKTQSGVSVIAAADGRIAEITEERNFGKTIKIDHEVLMLTTLYAHLQDYADDLKAGQEVKRGQLIGYVGNTGRSTGAHLHYGIYDMQKEQWVNPMTHILDQQPTLSR